MLYFIEVLFVSNNVMLIARGVYGYTMPPQSAISLSHHHLDPSSCQYFFLLCKMGIVISGSAKVAKSLKEVFFDKGKHCPLSKLEQPVHLLLLLF